MAGDEIAPGSNPNLSSVADSAAVHCLSSSLQSLSSENSQIKEATDKNGVDLFFDNFFFGHNRKPSGDATTPDQNSSPQEVASISQEIAPISPVIAPVSDPNLQLSSIADSVIARCAGLLFLSIEELQQSFRTKFSSHVRWYSTYARNLLEYCCFRALHATSKTPDCLADKKFRLLTYDMMLAWEAPDPESESMLNETSSCKHQEAYEDDGSLYYISSTNMAIQVDNKKTVGLEAFARIAPACPAIADPITVHNLFDALTCCSGGRLHFLIYDKYLKSLNETLKSVKSTTRSRLNSNLRLAEGEIILDVDGFMPTKPILQHIGISTWPGKLILTNHALYFEPLGVVSYNKAIRYDLATDLRQVIKREMTGPWGARLFDKAVMYKSNSLADPIFLEFPQLIGHSRRDYWFAITREVFHVHRFIRKFNLSQIQMAEALSRASLGIFRCRALKEAFHVVPSHFKTTLAFNLAEKLPKGDKILEALYHQLELLCTKINIDASANYSPNEVQRSDSFPVSFYALAKMGFHSLEGENWSKEAELLVADAHVGEICPLQKAVQESLGYSCKAEAARATLDQVKVEDIETNLAVIRELLFPLFESGKRLNFLAGWEDPLKSTMFLLFIFYVIYRGWIGYLLPSTFLSFALIMLWHKIFSKGKQIEAFQITLPPNRNPVELLLALQETISQLETSVQAGCITLLKIRALLFAAFPKTTTKVAFILIGTATILALIPLKYLVFLVFLEAYTREMPLRKANSEKLKRRIKEWWIRVPAAPVQLIRF
ncbi:uncharacterized protein A4U43_C07F21540 [Asparagus officinalis]|uniref:GRAM domain-containing protein n=1 Tax=Asparagus officinalis TaxID=4686 RepID=A0A5P1EDT2_ASPOF|nr:uncharacterized protein A4U43_C07F21540 [Asparagus officinalis]